MGNRFSSKNKMPQSFEYLAATMPNFKIIVVGPCQVGKTALVQRLIHNRFTEKAVHSTEVNIGAKLMTLADGSSVSLEIWDVPDTIQMDVSMVELYLKDTKGVVYVGVDAGLSEYFERLEQFTEMPSMVLGNKNDLEPPMALENWASEQKLKYWSVSAKSGENVYAAFKWLAEKLAIEN